MYVRSATRTGNCSLILILARPHQANAQTLRSAGVLQRAGPETSHLQGLPPLPIHLLPNLCVKSSYRLPVCHNDYVDSIESAGPEPLPSLLTSTAVGSYRGKFNFRHACPVNDCALRHCRVLLRAPLYPQRKEKENQINGLSTSVEPLIVQGMTQQRAIPFFVRPA